jgi:hypothetical protein
MNIAGVCDSATEFRVRALPIWHHAVRPTIWRSAASARPSAARKGDRPLQRLVMPRSPATAHGAPYFLVK